MGGGPAREPLRGRPAAATRGHGPLGPPGSVPAHVKPPSPKHLAKLSFDSVVLVRSCPPSSRQESAEAASGGGKQCFAFYEAARECVKCVRPEVFCLEVCAVPEPCMGRLCGPLAMVRSGITLPRVGLLQSGLIATCGWVQIPVDPAKWACDETGVSENLWLNLSTGSIGSGRQARPSWHNLFRGAGVRAREAVLR